MKLEEKLNSSKQNPPKLKFRKVVEKKKTLVLKKPQNTTTLVSFWMPLIRWATEKPIYEMLNQRKRIYLLFIRFAVKYMHTKYSGHFSESPFQIMEATEL